MSARKFAVRFFLLASLAASATASEAVTVPGYSDPWLAGMPNGSKASGSDVAPAQSPVRASQSISAGQKFTFSVSGWTSHTGSKSGPGPDGGTVRFHHQKGAENGISDVTAPANSLVGVFLGSARPNKSAAPTALSFNTVASRNFQSLSPKLKQVFFIGDGLNGNGRAQTFVAPKGVTRLFLGSMDAYGYYNNSGAFAVTVRRSGAASASLAAASPTPVPLPATGVLLLIALGTAAVYERWSRHPA